LQTEEQHPVVVVHQTQADPRRKLVSRPAVVYPKLEENGICFRLILKFDLKFSRSVVFFLFFLLLLLFFFCERYRLVRF
jgi:hypothetical protein